MDLNAALMEMRNAIAKGGRAQAREIARGLVGRLDLGGFPPTCCNNDDVRATVIAVIDGRTTSRSAGIIPSTLKIDRCFIATNMRSVGAGATP